MQTGRKSQHHLLQVNFLVPFNKEPEKISFGKYFSRLKNGNSITRQSQTAQVINVYGK